MSKADLDNPQKSQALRFCVATGLVPYLEVKVGSAVDVTASERLITDLDVLGLNLDRNGSFDRTIFDCKSNGPSPVNRAFWLAGMMQYVGASEGIVILGRQAEKAHRLTARRLNVHIFDSATFSDYAAATDPSFAIISTYSSDITAWHNLRDLIGKGHPSLQTLYNYLSTEVPLSRDPARRLRRLLALVREHRGELDPAKPFHMALVAEIALGVAVLLVPIMGQLRHVIDLSDDVDAFGEVLRYYIWGGREGVATVERMQELRGEAVKLGDFENGLLAWPQLVQLVRLLLEAPTALHDVCMPLRELVFRQVVAPDAQKDLAVASLLNRKRAKQFAIRIIGYTIAATKLPKEFGDKLVADLDRLAQLQD